MAELVIFDIEAKYTGGTNPTPTYRLRISVETSDPGTGTEIDEIRFHANGVDAAVFSCEDSATSGGLLTARIKDFDKKLLGLDTGDLKLNEVRLELRLEEPEAGWSVAAPHAALIFCGDAAGRTADTLKLPGDGTVDANIAVAVEVCAGLALIAPPDQAGGISNMAVRLGLPDFGFGSGWIPLSVLDPGSLDDFDVPGILGWFEDIIPDFDLGLDLPNIDWDVDFRLEFDMPLGLRAKSSTFQLRKIDGHYRVTATIKGLVLYWRGNEALDYEDFELSFVWEDDTYKLNAQLQTAQYPKAEAVGKTDPFGFGLPFGLLRVTADAWYFRIGLFAHEDNTGDIRFCLDTLLEIGGLALTSIAADGSEKDPFYRTDLRLHLRDASLMTGKLIDQRNLLSEAKGDADILKVYRGIDDGPDAFEQQSFATNLFAEPGAPNDFGVEFLDGDFQSGKRIFVAWKQGNLARMFKALSHELFGTEPAGALPDDATQVTLALEIAWFDGGGEERDTQVRLDIAADEAKSLAEADIELGDAGDGCFDLDEITNGIVLPGGPVSSGNFSEINVGKNPFSLSLAGLNLSVRRPEVHSLVYRREGDGTDSIAWLASWSKPLNLGKGHALAEASLDFSFTPQDGKRQVQPAAGGPLFRVVLGRPKDAPEHSALKVAGWRQGAGMSYLQVFDTDRAFSILPAAMPAKTLIDECPPRAAPALPALPISPYAFDDFSLSGDANGGFLLGLQSRIGQAVLEQFGDSGVTFEIEKVCIADPPDSLVVKTTLRMDIGSTEELTGAIDFRLRLSDLALSVDDGASLSLRRRATKDGLPAFLAVEKTTVAKGNALYVTDSYTLFGFELYGLIEAPNGEGSIEIDLLSLTFEDGSFRLQAPENVRLLLHYSEFGDNGLTFAVDSFLLGAGGLDLSGELLPTTLKLPGLQKPFALEQARIEIAGGRMSELSIAGTGKLPELLNDAPVTIALTLRQDDTGRVRLADLDCELGGGDAPIFSKGTKCRFDLTKITIDMDDADGTKPAAWFFRTSGSLQMQPDGIEFLGDLLEDFKSIRLEFADAPLGDEFFEHVELIAQLKKPERFKVLNLFEMEVRSIGFHPKFAGFAEPKPAIIIGGKIEFADLGDVPAVEVDFHRLYLGLPKSGELLPQTYAKGLRVEISTSGFKIAGRVDNIKNDLIDGFAGEGTVVIPGLPELSAAFSFAKLRATGKDTWKRGWFIAIEAGRISVQMGALPLYLRQIGLGFGYRYTSVLIKAFESEDKLGPLIELMLEEINNHHSLARIDSWAPDPERDGETNRWSIGLEAMFSMASANSSPTTYQPEGERQLRSVIAQMLLFLRSDFTFMAAAKLWYPVSADDFFENRKDMRRRPLALGFMAYSAPKSRLLIHAAKGTNPYLGPEDGTTQQKFLKEMLDNSHFEATFLSEPGLLHAELGWPDRLFFRYQIGALSLECRGGVLFRLEKDLLVQGVYFSARGEVSVSGGLSLGIVGTHISAHISVSLAMRLMLGISLSRPLDSTIYAAVGVDVSVAFSIHVWFRLKLKFFKIEIDLRFSLQIQIVVALEIGWAGQGDLGFKAQASVMISAFGRCLKVKIHVSAGSGVDNARQRLSPYMQSFLEPGGIPPIPGIEQRESVVVPTAELATAGGGLAAAEFLAPETPTESPAPDVGPAPDTDAINAKAGENAPLEEQNPGDADFVFALREGRAQNPNGSKLWFGWIMPSPKSMQLYPPIPKPADGRIAYANLKIEKPGDSEVYHIAETGEWVPAAKAGDGSLDIPLTIRPNASATLVPDDGEVDEPAGDGELTLRHLLAACYVPERENQFVDTIDDVEFPFPTNLPDDWSAATFPLEGAGLDVNPERVADDRLMDPDSDALNPRRTLDPDNRYDKALMNAIEAAEGENLDPMGSGDTATQRKALKEQALGNQSFLFRAFLDDLNWLSENATLDGDEAIIPALEGRGRPTLADLGMAVCVVANKCPEWLCRFPGEREPTATLRFAVADAAAPTKVPPVVDFHDSNFTLNPPDMREVAGKVDDEMLIFVWTIDWADGPPASIWNASGSEGTPQGPEIEDFLDHYEVQIFEEASTQPLERVTLQPCDILAPVEEGSEKLCRVKTRFQYVRKISELGLDRIRLLAGGTRIRAHILPVAQDGSRGRPLESVARYVASSVPLPADGATLRLEQVTKIPQERDDESEPFKATLFWRQPLPPNDPSVAATRRWELILRPVDPVPLGAYPLDTAELDNTPMIGTRGLGLRDGDIVVVFDIKPDESSKLPDIWEINPDRGTEPGNTGTPYSLDLNGGWDAMVTNHGAKLYDHRGAELESDSVARRRAMGFFDRKPATDPDGAGWRLLIRASAVDREDMPKDTLPVSGYGAPVQVPLLLVTPPPVEEVLAADQTPEPTRFRSLEFLEWPARQSSRQLNTDDLRYDLGPVAMAAIVPENGDLKLKYLARPGNRRAVTLTWNATDDDPATLIGTARFQIYEAQLDRPVNVDFAGVNNFSVDWTKVRAVRLTDRPFAARAVTSFVQPHVWDHTTPVARETLIRLGDAGISPDRMLRRWPGWYSWRESELMWPPLQKDALANLREKSRLATSSPFLQKAGKDAEPLEIAQTELAALYALGTYSARRNVHPWLALVIGNLVKRGAPAVLGGGADSAPGDGRTPLGRYDVEIAPGKPGPVDLIPDPIAWMQGDVEEQDPLGWGALFHLGLATTIALRNPVTGLYFGQDDLRYELGEAIGTVEKLIEEGKGDGWDLGVDREHLAIDLPLQTAQALRSGPVDRALSDSVALSMLQVSLRPVPVKSGEGDSPAYRYGVLNVPPPPKPAEEDEATVAKQNEDIEKKITFEVPVEVAYVDGGTHAVTEFHPGVQTMVKDVLRERGSTVLMRWIGATDQPVEAVKTAASSLNVERDKCAERFPIAARDEGLFKSLEDIPATPFGVFEVEPDAWRNAFKVGPENQPPRTRFSMFLDYLQEAFAVGDNQAAANESAAALREAVVGHPNIAELYTTWSHRFFAAAPMPVEDEKSCQCEAETPAAGDEPTADPIDPNAIWHPRRLTAATPQRDEPALMAPDDLGRMSYTHIIDEDWASLRAYAVRTVPRYWDLLEMATEITPPELTGTGGRIDVSIPRRRKVLAPKVLGIRVLTDINTDRHFHEVSTSEHVEQALSRSSIALARKLEFQDTLRHFSIEFRDDDWIRQLADKNLSEALENYSIADAPTSAKEDAQLPAPGLGEDDYLSFVPIARFGANRSVVAAEPFYYSQIVTLAARSVEVASLLNRVPLPRPPAAQPVPFDGEPTTWMGPNAKQWSAFEVDIAPVDPDTVPEPARPYLKPQGPTVRIRFPRLLEMLPPGSLDAHFAAEKDARSFGRLPDLQSRLEIVQETSTGRATLATITAHPSKVPEDDPFEKVTLAKGFTVGIAQADGKAPAPLYFDAAWTRRTVRQGWTASPLQPPMAEALAQLAPLAMRLAHDENENELSVVDPFGGPRWLFRPSVDRAEMFEAGLNDISAGLRLLLHPAHGVALIDEVLADGDVLKTIDDGLVPVLSAALRAGPELKNDFDDQGTLWFINSTGWRKVGDGEVVAFEDGSRFLLVLKMETEAGRPVFSSDASDAYSLFLNRVPPAVGVPAVGDVGPMVAAIHDLASWWLRATGRQTWRVVAHHGNLDGVGWGAVHDARGSNK